MAIYQLTVTEDGEWVMPEEPVDPDLFERFFALDGTRQVDWEPPRMEFLDSADDGTPRAYSDFPWFLATAPVLRRRAIERVGKYLDPYGEFLPLDCDEAIALFNVTNILDALDEPNSEIVRFDDGSILDIDRYAFIPAIVEGHDLFKLPMRGSLVFVSGRLIEKFRHAGILKVRFELAWQDGEEARCEPVIEL